MSIHHDTKLGIGLFLFLPYIMYIHSLDKRRRRREARR